MKDEFGAKHTDVANVLKQFGPSRLTKSPDKSVQDFYFEWSQAIPEIMKPSTEQEHKDFADLIHRAMYYISLNDTYLQQALSDLKTPNPTLKSYFDETIAAESRRKCFQDIATSSSSLDSKGVTISKWDASYMNKKSFNNKSDSKTTVFKGAKPKDTSQSDVSDSTQGKNSKGGNKGQKQNYSSDQKPNQNSNQINSKPDAKKGRYCTICKTEIHSTEYCKYLEGSKYKSWLKNKSQQKHVKKVEESNANNDSQDDLYPDYGFGSLMLYVLSTIYRLCVILLPPSWILIP